MICNNRKDSLRNNIVKKLNRCVKSMKISRKIEKGIYNYIIGYSIDNNIQRNWGNKMFHRMYMKKVISIYSNLDSKCYVGNTSLVKRIKDGEIEPESLAKMNSHEIYPEIWTELLDKKTKCDKMKYEMKQEAMTEMFKCRKCNSRKCSYYELQTRSADEPMTQFINCLDCGNRWKQ